MRRVSPVYVVSATTDGTSDPLEGVADTVRETPLGSSPEARP